MGVNSLEWNDGLERWNGLLEWSTGLDRVDEISLKIIDIMIVLVC